MASILVKRLMSSNLRSPSLLLRPVTPFHAVAQPFSSRLFNTNVARESDSNDCDPPVVSLYTRDVASALSALSELLGPLSSTRPRQPLKPTDPNMVSPSAQDVPKDYVVRQTADGRHLRFDMPGLDKKDVKVSVDDDYLIMKGEGEKEFEDEESGRSYCWSMYLPKNVYKTTEIKAEMKNGVLKVFLPWVKEEERTNVFHVAVD